MFLCTFYSGFRIWEKICNIGILYMKDGNIIGFNLIGSNQLGIVQVVVGKVVIHPIVVWPSSVYHNTSTKLDQHYHSAMATELVHWHIHKM